MIKSVSIAAAAGRDFKEISDYLATEFGPVVLQNFVDRFDEVCLNLLNHPTIYRVFLKKKKIRRCVMSKQCVILFKIDTDVVEIVRIFDTRQDPKGLISIL